MPATLPERIATLEERLSNVALRLENIVDKMDDVHNFVQQGKGAKMAMITVVSAISGAVGAGIHKLFPH